MANFGAVVLVTSTSVVASLAYGQCWRLSLIDKACTLAWCEDSPCPGESVVADDNVYAKASDTPGRDAVSIDALCRINYLVKNQFGQCAIPDYCESLVGSYVLTGGFCPEGGPE